MTDFSEQMESFTRMQQAAFEPMRQFNQIAVDAFEKLARQNYNVVGDVIDYSVKQARTPLESENVSDVLGVQLNNTREFSEQLARRASEYGDLAKEMQTSVVDVVNTTAADVTAAKPAAKPTAKRAA